MKHQKTNNSSSYKWLTENKWSFVFILILSFVLYGNTIGHYYNMDDVFVVKDNAMVQKGISAIPEIFTSRYFENSQAKFGYRPFTKAVFAIEVSLFGVNPHVSHFINILLYALLAYVMLLWLKRILANNVSLLFIWAVLLLWMFHPVHTEVVASLKNREEILYLLFAVWASIHFMNFIETGKWYQLLLALLLFVCSYLSKQSAIAFTLMLPIVFYFKYLISRPLKDFLQINTFKNVQIIRIVLSLIVLWYAAYIMYKLPTWLFPSDELELFSFENPLRYNHTWSARFSMAALTLLYYLRLLVFPHPLLFYYGLYTIPEVTITDAIVWLSVILHIFIILIFIKLWKKSPYLLYGFLIYLAAIFPFSNYMMEINGIVADRFLNAPSLGFSITVVSLLFVYFKVPFVEQNLKMINAKAKYIFFIILILYGIKTISRNSYWRSEIKLFSHDIEYLDNSVKANDILAQNIMDRVMQNNPLQHSFSELKPQLDSVLKYYLRTLELFPDNPKALNNVANLYINFYNEPQKALEFLHKAYRYKPQSFEVNFNLGMSYEMLKQDTLAIRYYVKALNINKQYPKLWQSIINYYFRVNKNDSAKYYAEQMLRYDTLTDIPYVSIGYYYLTQYDTSTAIKFWEKGFAINPTSYQRALTLGQYFQYKKDTAKARYYFEKANLLKLTQPY
ncbi:MAG: hypothetical protein HPY79_10985 [Bacteroidales bacterium]|nr:hypothetical protein [Bacteroidales bacterium]